MNISPSRPQGKMLHLSGDAGRFPGHPSVSERPPQRSYQSPIAQNYRYVRVLLAIRFLPLNAVPPSPFSERHRPLLPGSLARGYVHNPARQPEARSLPLLRILGRLAGLSEVVGETAHWCATRRTSRSRSGHYYSDAVVVVISGQISPRSSTPTRSSGAQPDVTVRDSLGENATNCCARSADHGRCTHNRHAPVYFCHHLPADSP